MIAKTSHRLTIGLATCLAASSLAMGAVTSPATGAPATQTVQLAAANIQPRAGASFDDTIAYVGQIAVQDDSPTTQRNPATVAVDFGDDTAYVANAWSGTVEAIAPGQFTGVTSPRTAVGSVVSVVAPPSFPPGSAGNVGLYGLAVNSVDDTVYVVNRGQNPAYIWAINGRTLTVDDTGTLSACNTGNSNPAGYTPAYHLIAVDSSDDTVYVPCNAGGVDAGKARILAINGATLDVDDSYTTAAAYTYSGVAVSSLGKILVSGWDGISGAISVFDPTLDPPVTWATPFSQPSAVVVGDDTAYVSSYTTNALWGRNMTSGATTSVTLGGANATQWQGLAYRGGSTPMVLVGSQSGVAPGAKAVNLSDMSVTQIYGGGTSTIAVGSNNVIYLGNDWVSQYTYGTARVLSKVPAIPAAPTGVAGNAQVSVTWSPPASGIPITNYKVTATPGGASCTTTPPATSCTMSPLTAGTAYTFTLQASNAAGWSSASAASAPVTPNAYPGAPTGVTAVAGIQAATVSWTAPVNMGFPATLTSYRVTANPGGAQCTATPPATTCTVSPLTAGTAYTFTVEAENSTGWSPPSGISNAVTPSAPPAPPPPPPTPVPSMSVTMASSPMKFEKAGDMLTYTVTVRNNGTDNLNNLRIDVPGVALTCVPAAPVASLNPDRSVVCTGTYKVTEADAAARLVRTSATARATAQSTGSPITSTVTLDVKGPDEPDRLELRVVMGSTPASFARAGDSLSFSALVTNTGNIPVRDVIITGSLPDAVCVPVSPVRSVAPGATIRCAGTYKVTRADTSAGVVRGLTRATGSSASGGRVAATGAVEVLKSSPERPSVKVRLSATPDSFRRAGQTITLKAVATNRGDVALTNVAVTGSPGRFSCEPGTPVATLAVDGVVTCTAKYAVTAADVRAGVIRASARAVGTSPGGSVTSDDVSMRIKDASPPRGRVLPYLVPRVIW